MMKCSEYCDHALRSFLGSKEQIVKFISPFTVQYTVSMMNAAIKRARRQETIGCGEKSGFVMLYRKGVRSIEIIPVEEEVPENPARKVLDAFLESGYPKAKVGNGMKEYQAIYRLCGHGKYWKLRAHIRAGEVVVEVKNGRQG